MTTGYRTGDYEPIGTTGLGSSASGNFAAMTPEQLAAL